MKPTSDRQLVASRTRDALGRDFDCYAIVDKHGGFVLEGNGGFILFALSGPKTYKVTLGFAPDSRGKNAIDALNEGYAWVFENTDAEILIGYMHVEDKATLSIGPHIIGGQIDRTDGDTVISSITRERWTAARAKA